MTRTRSIVLSVSLVALLAASAYVFWRPSQKADLMIAPVSGPTR
jgi:hypothetical protein